MKQVFQNLRTGKILLEDTPAPGRASGNLVVQTKATLISAGTERMLVEFGKASLIGKARAQPDKVKQLLEKLRTDGVLPTLEAVFNRLDEPLPLGYCNAGVVVEIGADVEGFQVGDRVASNGPHAEFVSVPSNLCAKISDSVTDRQAAFTVLSSIGLQGIRLARPELGEKVVVYGLGLIGQVTVQLLRAQGCDVLGVDLHTGRLEHARRQGARGVAADKDPVAVARAWTRGRGVDAVVICASANSDDIVHHAATMCRKRGTIVLVGVVGLHLQRSDFYEKELSFQVSCSYGPGRYDDNYELAGRDYPYGFVRWTEQRNFEAVLQMIESKRLDVDGLITNCLPFERAVEAYEKLRDETDTLGIVLEYGAASEPGRTVRIGRRAPLQSACSPTLAVVGAGNFSKMTLMPALSRTSASVKYVCDLNGGAAAHLARKFGAESAVSEIETVLADKAVDAVIIAAGHSAHAKLVCETLAANKHAFVEKPMAMSADEIVSILEAMAERPELQVTVGFNRRFSPHIQKMKTLLAGRSEPLAMTMTINAGIIPPGHWVHDPERGGGRIIGEACHFIDLMSALAEAPVESVAAFMVGPGPAVREDKMTISLGFADGSIGSVNYLGNGSRSYPKELMEVFSDGRVLRLNNFRSLEGFGFKGFKGYSTRSQDKGHTAELAAYVESLRAGGDALIPIASLVNSTLASFAARTSAAEGRVLHLNDEYVDVLERVVAL